MSPPEKSPFAIGIQAKLLVVHALLVIVPFVGLWFARTFERELLRSEEEGMVAVARTLAAQTDDASLGASAIAAAHSLRCQVRILDATGASRFDTGAEPIEPPISIKARVASVSEWGLRRVPLDAEADVAATPEVQRALRGEGGRATRVPARFKGVRLFVAEPAFDPAGHVRGVVYVSRTTYPVLMSLYRVKAGLFRAFAVSFVLALVVATFLALTLSRPLRALTTSARRIAQGERGVALNLRRGDEIGDLARAFDAMASELDARLAYTAGLAANVSHEFKTPIASIRGAAELLRDGAADDAGAREKFLGNIIADTERLNRLVTRLLELSRIEAGDEQVLCDYRALVEDEVGRAKDAGRNVTLIWESPNAHLVGDASHLASVLGNLLDNAAHFSAPESPIVVRVTGDDETITTSVEDRGVGISADAREKIWERFYTSARDAGGTGLGLPIVRAVVEAHGGTVTVESEVGVGSTFVVRLPRRVRGQPRA